ncbi:monofunctional biosynthetic peptidoglycan transglycosylase [Marinobacter vulgaris]|uniref:Biosynthetic peptidoglycan transglycosylase n=1 Tax=Marinobacter vulgaris TaxID=1928331 RepID=A0A2V3ZHI2_9GAMM|nr:monofunctional biosynthetic peptidoglycan transglycosylase [Marinobacter vulgaris]PXX89644.1 monofunctional biosynthetic peptidoglycan transglycosylase [Marinobacter vulgaris]TSJ68633.1 monofunctional biosynthetic peptidoglycan transglycosylase [Marinobacter vulgaris]
MARHSLIRKYLRSVAWTLAGAFLLIIAMILLFRFVNPPTSTFMLGHLLSGSSHELRQQWVSLDDISPWMPLAVVASEDQRFPHHRGVDFGAIRKALAEYQAGQGLRGASTITQQTAKNLFLWSGRSFSRKALEAGLALAIDALWPKRRIIEVYLNIAEFGHGVYGVEAASRLYFGIPASQLSQTQAARLAAVLPNPKVLDAASPSAYVWERVAWIRGQMVQLSGLRYLQGLYN